jgi:hypothetical protein
VRAHTTATSLLARVGMLLGVASCTPLQAQAGEGPPCAVVHGRLFIANGTPSIRIWKVGTRRILGVVSPHTHDSEGPDVVPNNVWNMIEGPDAGQELYGDFKVCPITPPHRGWMQLVTLASGEHLVLRHRPDR